jgi:hypothetical protein
MPTRRSDPIGGPHGGGLVTPGTTDGTSDLPSDAEVTWSPDPQATVRWTASWIEERLGSLGIRFEDEQGRLLGTTFKEPMPGHRLTPQWVLTDPVGQPIFRARFVKRPMRETIGHGRFEIVDAAGTPLGFLTHETARNLSSTTRLELPTLTLFESASRTIVRSPIGVRSGAEEVAELRIRPGRSRYDLRGGEVDVVLKARLSGPSELLLRFFIGYLLAMSRLAAPRAMGP